MILEFIRNAVVITEGLLMQDSIRFGEGRENRMRSLSY
jgi:hypothetical protein